MNLIKTALVGAIALFLVPAGPAEAKKVTIKMATLAPDGSAWDKLLREMADEWKQATDGRVQLRLYPGGVAGDDPDIVRKMRIGQIQGAALTIAGLSDIDPGFNVFAIPLFFESDEEFLFVRDRMTGFFRERLEERGFQFLGWGHGGWVHIFLTSPVETVKDLQEVKMFTWAGDDRMSEVWKKTGFSPVSLASTDILTGLQTGLIDAIPTTPYAALAMQWFRQTPYMLDVSLAPLMGATVVSRKTWGKVETADREALLAAAADPEDSVFHQIAESDAEAVTEMQKRGLTVIDVDETTGAWAESARKFADEMQKALVPEDVFRLALEYRGEFRDSQQP